MVLHSHAPDWTYEETKHRLLMIPFRVFRDFACMSYMLGARITETYYISPKHISEIIISNGEKRLTVDLLTEKNPHVERRNIPINPYTEKEYANILYRFKTEFDPDSFPFTGYSIRTYQRKMRTFLDIHPHALRHLRVHHIDDNTVPGFKPLTPRQFQDYFGWETIMTSSHYQSRTRTKDLAEKS